MKLLGILLFSLLALIQYPLWIGPGSWFRVWELDSLLSDQQARNAGLRLRNEGLEAELEDLRHGKLAIEERARYSLGMIRNDEIFVQLTPTPAQRGAGGAALGPAGALPHRGTLRDPARRAQQRSRPVSGEARMQGPRRDPDRGDDALVRVKAPR